MTTYRFLGEFDALSASVGYDNEDYGVEGIDDHAQFVQYWYIYLNHGDRLDMNLHTRIHQPTVDFNHNTEAIWEVTFFGLDFGGTPEFDTSDFVEDRTATYWNTGINDPTFPISGPGYYPGRWLLFEQWNTFGSMEFNMTWVRVPLDDGPDHPGFTPAVSRGGGGGWHVGHA